MYFVWMVLDRFSPAWSLLLALSGFKSISLAWWDYRSETVQKSHLDLDPSISADWKRKFRQSKVCGLSIFLTTKLTFSGDKVMWEKASSQENHLASVLCHTRKRLQDFRKAGGQTMFSAPVRALRASVLLGKFIVGWILLLYFILFYISAIPIFKTHTQVPVVLKHKDKFNIGI